MLYSRGGHRFLPQGTYAVSDMPCLTRDTHVYLYLPDIGVFKPLLKKYSSSGNSMLAHVLVNLWFCTFAFSLTHSLEYSEVNFLILYDLLHHYRSHSFV